MAPRHTLVEPAQTGQISPRNMSRKERLTMTVGLRNMWVRPDVHVIADAAADHVNPLRRTTLKVDGLLCSL
jgi:hypothetical protein